MNNSYTAKQLSEIVVLMNAIKSVINDTEDLQIHTIPVAHDSVVIGQIEILDESVFFYPVENSEE